MEQVSVYKKKLNDKFFLTLLENKICFFNNFTIPFEILLGIFQKHHLVDGTGKLVMLKYQPFLTIAIIVVMLFAETRKKPKNSCKSLEKLVTKQNKKYYSYFGNIFMV